MWYRFDSICRQCDYVPSISTIYLAIEPPAEIDGNDEDWMWFFGNRNIDRSIVVLFGRNIWFWPDNRLTSETFPLKWVNEILISTSNFSPIDIVRCRFQKANEKTFWIIYGRSFNLSTITSFKKFCWILQMQMSPTVAADAFHSVSFFCVNKLLSWRRYWFQLQSISIRFFLVLKDC